MMNDDSMGFRIERSDGWFIAHASNREHADELLALHANAVAVPAQRWVVLSDDGYLESFPTRDDAQAARIKLNRDKVRSKLFAPGSK
jgi:hypothetical protein